MKKATLYHLFVDIEIYRMTKLVFKIKETLWISLYYTAPIGKSINTMGQRCTVGRSSA